MLKIIPSSDYGVPPLAPIKVASSGLRGKDLSDLVVRSGNALAHEVQKMSFAPGEVPIHLIAMGSTESVGPNRNFDGWRASVLQQYHPTFQKHAKFFRDHENKPHHPHYGIVKLSYYNPTMQRVELIVTLNGTKSIADTNGGRIADRELEKLASGKDIPVSMSARVPRDQCSACGHYARNRDEYCDGPMCKYGGLKANIGRTFEDGHTLHADNPEPLFFDISHVYRPADRTAYVLGPLRDLVLGS